MTFREFVEGKSVALIAPSAHVMGTRQRELIESHDLVARINRGFPVPPQLVPDIGDRTDILFHLLNVHIAASEHEFAQCVGKVRFVVSVHPHGHNYTTRFQRINRGRIPFEAIPTSTRQAVRMQVRKSPNAGIIAITHMLDQPIKDLYLTGFGFYEYGYYTGYGGRDARQAKAMKGGQSGHDQNSQKAYVKRLLASTTIPVTMDETMRRILGNHQSPKDQMRTIAELPRDKVVKVTALMDLRHGADTVRCGDSFLVTKRDAEILISKHRAALL